jgi:formylglycine-generating enzyme required for sulfatase activity
MKAIVFSFLAIASMSAVASGPAGYQWQSLAANVKVERVVVRQQWPWTTDVKVEYVLAGEGSGAVDVAVELYNGEERLLSPSLDEAISGDLYGRAPNSVGTIIIDPVKAFGTSRQLFGKFKVKLTLTPSADNINEVIYKILNLDQDPVTITDVTRADILGRKYGTFETTYGDNFFRNHNNRLSTPLTDILIWTGVTNGDLYRTSKLALRKIPAAQKSYMMGQGADDSAKVQVTFTKDFWIGVFPMTQAHVKRFKADYMGHSTNALYGAVRAADKISWDLARGNRAKWPNGNHADAADSSIIGLIQAATGNYRFDLPTDAQWEFAARGGNSSIYYGGPNQNYANTVIGAYRSKTTNDDDNAANKYSNADWSKNSYPPGWYVPNAYGLYDTFYNVTEWCLDQAVKDDQGQWLGRNGGEDPRGADIANGGVNGHPSGPAHVFRGGGHGYPFGDIGQFACTVDWWSTGHLGMRLCLHEED